MFFRDQLMFSVFQGYFTTAILFYYRNGFHQLCNPHDSFRRFTPKCFLKVFYSCNIFREVILLP